MPQLEQFKQHSRQLAYDLAAQVLSQIEASTANEFEAKSFSDRAITRMIFFTAQENGIKLDPVELNEAEDIVMAVLSNVYVGSGDIQPNTMPFLKAGQLMKILSKVNPETRVYIDAERSLKDYRGPVFQLDDLEGATLDAISPFQAIICEKDHQKAILITTHY